MVVHMCVLPLSVVHCLGLAAIDGDDDIAEQPDLPTQHHDLAAYPADGLAVFAAEVSDRFEVGRQSARQPHQLDIATRLCLETAARVNAVEIAVDIDLQKDCRMIARPSGCRRHCSLEAQLDQSKRIDNTEERRAGKECVDTCQSRWPASH